MMNDVGEVWGEPSYSWITPNVKEDSFCYKN